MNTEDVPNRMPSMWEPMQKPLDVALIGKTNEEIGELIIELGMLLNIMNRCLIQGLAGLNPETEELNKTALQNEVADTLAKLAQMIADFGLDVDAIMKRVGVKHTFSGHWFDWLRANMPKPEELEVVIELVPRNKYTFEVHNERLLTPMRYYGVFLKMTEDTQTKDVYLRFACKLGNNELLSELTISMRDIVPGSIVEGWVQ